MKDAHWYSSRYDALESERSNLDDIYELIDDLVIPGRGQMFERRGGSELSKDWSKRNLFSSAALVSSQILAASINSNLTSASTRWFSYRFGNTTLNSNTTAKRWLEDADAKVFDRLYQSNFGVEASEFYLDAVTFGTPCMFHDYTMRRGEANFNFKTMETRGFYFEQDVHGLPTSVWQKREYSISELRSMFSELPAHAKEREDVAGSVMDRYEVVHIVYLEYKNKEKVEQADLRKTVAEDSRPYQEKFVCITGSPEFLEPLNKTAYHEMPAYVLRWSRIAGSKFGYSPSFNAMPDLLSLNQLIKIDLKAREKNTDPPMQAQDRGVVSSVIDLNAGGITNTRTENAIRPLFPPIRLNDSDRGIDRLTASIRSIYFVDQLELKESPAMTATEVNVRYELMQRILGPTMARFRTDFLDPMLKRCFFIMLREGEFGEIPQEIRPEDLDIEYVGPLARSQKLDEVVAIERIIQATNGIAPLDQGVLDAYDWPKALKLMGERLGVPAKIERSDAEIGQIQKARRDQQEKQAQMDQMDQMANAMKTGAEGAAALEDVNLTGMM